MKTTSNFQGTSHTLRRNRRNQTVIVLLYFITLRRFGQKMLGTAGAGVDTGGGADEGVTPGVDGRAAASVSDAGPGGQTYDRWGDDQDSKLHIRCFTKGCAKG